MVKTMYNFVKNIFLSLLVISLFSSCKNSSLDGSNPITLNFPESQFYNALIITNDDLTVLVNGGENADLQWYAKENDKEFTRFTFTENTDCFSTKRYYSYETLPDGRLQIWKWCLTDKGGENYLLAYDWGSHQLEKIIGPLPLGSSGASWNPEQTQAIAYLDSKFATKTLYWINRNKFEPLDLEITDGEQSWNLQDDFPKFVASDTGESGTTGRASWSPNGKRIAFFASPNAIGNTGFNRFGVEHYLYLMNPETLEYEVVADNIYSPFLLVWSPDSTHIAFIGKRGFSKENGIWLYSTKTNTITNISKGIYQGIVWRSNTNVVAIQCEDLEVCNQIIEYDISNLLDN